MPEAKDKDHGLCYVVDNKAADVRHAVSAANYNSKKHTKVRPLQPGETPLGYTPKRLTKKDETNQQALPQGHK